MAKNSQLRRTALTEAIEQLKQKENLEPEDVESIKHVKLYGIYPPIEKLDMAIGVFKSCEKLSLSTNCIEKIANLNSLRHLRILSLGRNYIKNLNGVEAVGDTLQELWISYNFIEKLKGIETLKKLRVCYMANNRISHFSEVTKFNACKALEELVLIGNPIEEKMSSEGTWRDEVCRTLVEATPLRKLDCVPILRPDDDIDQPKEGNPDLFATDE